MPDETLRDSLESAFDEHTNTETPAPPEPVQTPPAPAGDEPPAPSGDQPPAGEEQQATGQRARDEHGRFAKGGKSDAVASQKPAAPGSLPLPGQQPADQQAQQQQQPDPHGRAPQSWRPGAREAWAKLPPEVREEIHRRERESAQIVQESAQARQVSTYLQRLQQQYAPALQAEGVDALTAAGNLIQYASRLRYGSPVEKAQLCANLVRVYGVDVVALAAALDGQPVQQQGGQQQGIFQDPRVDQLLAQLNQAQTARAESVQAKAVSDVETFGQGKEFFEDVRADMGDLMELAAKRGIDMSLQQAYDRCCAMNPDIAKVMAARTAATRNGNGNPSIQRARAAASSVRGTPSNGSSTPPPTDLRGAIEAAIDAVDGR